MEGNEHVPVAAQMIHFKCVLLCSKCCDVDGFGLWIDSKMHADVMEGKGGLNCRRMDYVHSNLCM